MTETRITNVEINKSIRIIRNKRRKGYELIFINFYLHHSNMNVVYCEYSTNIRDVTHYMYI